MKQVDLRIKDEKRKAEGKRTQDLLWEWNQCNPASQRYKEIVKELFCGQIGKESKVHTPFYCNLAKNIHIGNRVTIMPYFKCMSARSQVYLEDDVRIALDVKVITNNHDFYQRDILTVEDVHMCAKRMDWSRCYDFARCKNWRKCDRRSRQCGDKRCRSQYDRCGQSG